MPIKGPQRAAFIWGYGTDPLKLIRHIEKANELNMEYVYASPQPILGYEDNWVGPPTYAVLKENIFDHSSNIATGFLTGTYTRAWIVIDDHSSNLEFLFNGNDGAYKCKHNDTDYPPIKPGIKNWLDDPNTMYVDDMCVVVMGPHSGMALNNIWYDNRIVICSMEPGENVDPDQFDLTNSLTSEFDWRAAYDSENSRLQGQHPCIKP
jgi:hypothetical protein